MKYGAHIFLWTNRWTREQLPLLARMRKLGLDCAEIAVGDDVTFNAAETGAHARSLGIELVLSPGALWPMECDISHDDSALRAKGLAWHRHWIDQAADAGAAAYTGAIYGHPGRVCRRPQHEDELQWAAENLHLLAEHAAGLGVKLVLEPMSHFRTHLVNTPAQAMRLLAIAGHPNISILFDTYHMITEVRDYAAAIRTFGGRLWGVHACENDRGVPGGGLVPWPAIAASLAAIGFDGYMIMESYNSSLGEFAVSRGMFHNVCPDGDAFVRQGMEFLKKRIG